MWLPLFSSLIAMFTHFATVFDTRSCLFRDSFATLCDPMLMLTSITTYNFHISLHLFGFVWLWCQWDNMCLRGGNGLLQWCTNIIFFAMTRRRSEPCHRRSLHLSKTCLSSRWHGAARCNIIAAIGTGLETKLFNQNI